MDMHMDMCMDVYGHEYGHVSRGEHGHVYGHAYGHVPAMPTEGAHHFRFSRPRALVTSNAHGLTSTDMRSNNALGCVPLGPKPAISGTGTPIRAQ